MGINYQLVDNSKVIVLLLGIKRLVYGSNSDELLKTLKDVLSVYGLGVKI